MLLAMTAPAPGETLYSVLARTSVMIGSVPDARFTRVAFGGRPVRIDVDVPTGVGGLIHPWSPWTAERLVTAHTPFNYLAHWTAPELAKRLFASMIGFDRTMTADRVHEQRRRRRPMLTACPECLEADAGKLGVGCWRVHHQLPGVYRCAEHDEPLRTSTVATAGQRRFLTCSRERVGERIEAPFDAAIARDLSRASRALLDEPFVPTSPRRIQGVFRRRLGDAGWLTRHGMTKRRLPEAIRARYGVEGMATMGLRFGAFRGSHPMQGIWGWAAEPRGPALWRLLVLDFMQIDPLAFLRECRAPDRNENPGAGCPQISELDAISVDAPAAVGWRGAPA